MKTVFFVVLGGALACTSKPEHCPRLESELLGAATIDQHRRFTFDRKNLPRVITGTTAARLEFFWNEDGALKTETSTRTRDQIVRVRGEPLAKGTGRLRLRSGRRVCGEWDAAFSTPSDELPDVQTIRALRNKARFDEAVETSTRLLAAADPNTKLWLSVERARAIESAHGHAEAIEAWKQAAGVAEELGASSQVSRRLRAASFRAVRARRFREAEALFPRARPIDEKIGNQAGLVQLAYGEAELAQTRGDLLRATRLLEHAVERATFLAMDDDVSSYLELLAFLYAVEGRHQKALETIAKVQTTSTDPERRARGLLNELVVRRAVMAGGALEKNPAELLRGFKEALALLPNEGQPDLRANLYQKLASVSLETGDVAAAAEWVERFRALPKSGSTFVVRQLELVEADVFLAQNELDRAAAAYRETARRAREESVLASEVLWRALEGVARTEMRRGRLESARKVYLEALAALDEAVRSTPLLEPRAQFLAERGPAVERAIELFLSTGAHLDVFRIAERRRQWVFDALEVKTRLATLSADRKEQWEAWLAEHERATQQLDHLRAERAGARVEKLTAIDARILELHHKVAADLAGALAAVGSMRNFSSVPDPSAIAKKLGPRRALLMFVDPLALWIDHRGLTLDAHGAWKARLAKLEHLYVVSGGLDLTQMIKGTSWSELNFAEQLIREPRRAQGAPVVLADPDFTLKNARLEGANIARRWPDGQLYLGTEVTKDRLLTALENARVVHYAGHLDIPDDRPWNIGFRLHREAVRLDELLTRPLGARLLFLSGCRASHAVRLSEGSTVSLAELLLASGVETIIGPTEAISDELARNFAERFYQEGGDVTPGPAFRRTVEHFGETTSFRLYGAP